MVVEWGRRCYGSVWHLFKDNPSLATGGRYYVAEPGTPHVPGSHNLASRDWHDKNWKTAVILGEDMTSVQTWDEGVPPAVVPLARFVGSQSCVANGELEADAAEPGQLDDGFPLACYAPPGEADPRWHEVASFNSCSMQRFYAKIIEWIGEDDEESIVEAFTALLGTDVQIRLHKATGIMPGVATVIHPTFSICCVDGTRNFQQLALQAFDSVEGPVNYGLYGTVPIWYAASTWVHNWLNSDGQAPGTPIMFAGHSYGGATVMNVAARYRHGTPSRTIRYMTFGSPKPGDQRLHDLVATCPGVNIANDGDLVTVLPPDYLTLLPVMLAIGFPTMIRYRSWVRPPVQTLQDSMGVLFINTSPILDSIQLTAMMANIIASLPQAPIFEHRITEYYRRIAHRCPEAEWPISEEIIEILDELHGDVGLATALEPANGSLGLWNIAVLIPDGDLGLAAPAGADDGDLGLDAPFDVDPIGLTEPLEAGQGGLGLSAAAGADDGGLALDEETVDFIYGGGACGHSTPISPDIYYTSTVEAGTDRWYAMDPSELPPGTTDVEVMVMGITGVGGFAMRVGDCDSYFDVDSVSDDGTYVMFPFELMFGTIMVILSNITPTDTIYVTFRIRPLP